MQTHETHCSTTHEWLVHRAIAGYLIHHAGFTGDIAQTGAVTLIQRFGSALNLNIHFPMLFLDGVYHLTEGSPSFRRIKAPTAAALAQLVHTLSERLARHLERRGWWVRDDEHEFLTLSASDDSTLDELRGHSITYRIALGPHAGVVAAADERDKLERLCR